METGLIAKVLRAIQAIFAIIILGLTAYGKPLRLLSRTSLTTSVANWWSGHWHRNAPSEVGFLVFTSIWTLLALLYLMLAPRFFPTAAHKFGILGAEALTMLFWFAGFIAMAVWLTDRLCYGGICTTAKAAAVFAAFEW